MITRKLVVTDAANRAFKKLPKGAQKDFAKALQDVMEDRRPGMEFKPLNNLGKGIKGVIELIINGSPAHRLIGRYTWPSLKVKYTYYTLSPKQPMG